MTYAPCDVSLEAWLAADPVAALRHIDAELAGQSLGDFIRSAWPILEPGTPYLHNWHIDAISEYLEAVTRGEIRRLLINMPPRYMKSIAVSVMWPVWEWIRIPEQRWLFASYSASLSTKHSVDRRTLIRSDWYQQNWGGRFQLAGDQDVKTEFMNTRRGVMVATSVGGTSTGKGGNRLVVDDPHNPQQADSDVERAAAVEWLDQTFYTRQDDKKAASIVVVMQRLHERDASARCIEQGYTHLSLPAVSEGRTVVRMPGGAERIREDGELLWPEREGPAEMAETERAMGPYGFAGQYQQRP